MSLNQTTLSLIYILATDGKAYRQVNLLKSTFSKMALAVWRPFPEVQQEYP